MLYRVHFGDGSTELIEARDLVTARRAARSLDAGEVTKVVCLGGEDEFDDEEDEDDEEDDY